MTRTLAIAVILLVSAAPCLAVAHKHHPRHRARTGAAVVRPIPGPDRTASQRAVCRSQCALERMSCDQGRATAYQNRADQLQAAQSNCGLAVQSCLSRC